MPSLYNSRHFFNSINRDNTMKRKYYVHRINPQRTAKVLKVSDNHVILQSFLQGQKENDQVTQNLNSFLERYKEIKSLNQYHKDLKHRLKLETIRIEEHKAFRYKRTKKSVSYDSIEVKCLDCDYKPKEGIGLTRAKKCLMRHIVEHKHKGSIKEVKTTIYESLD